MSDSQAITSAVANLYNTYPFPPEPLLNEPPPGYNWRWHWTAAYSFCTGKKPPTKPIRILDAGCGTGAGTEYLIHLNPQAEIVGIDISEKALEIAQKRCEQSGVLSKHLSKVEFKKLPLQDASLLSGEFDLINCVGVLHHLPDPIAGIQALASKLAPGGLFHIFVYAELGRWEIQLMQQAIAKLANPGNYQDGVKVGREIFASLPENNRLVKREKERWSLENHRDESFADMYVHPQEVDYNINTLFKLIEASGLEFIGFSNPSYWQLERLIAKSPLLKERASQLTPIERYRLIELLDPEITHYEFFLGRSPQIKENWSDEQKLLKAIPEIHPCITGWPSYSLFNADYELVKLSEQEYKFLDACGANPQEQKTVKQLQDLVGLSLESIRLLFNQRLIILDFPV